MCGIDLAIRAAAHAEFLTRAEESAIYDWTELSTYVAAHGIDLITLARRDIAFGLTAVAFVGMVIYSGLEPRFLSTLLMSRLTVE